jgi:membrane-bound serine protease (ClpP class)
VSNFAIAVAVVLFLLAFYLIFKKSILNYSELKEHGYVGVTDKSSLVGQEGVTVTDLHPTGTVLIEGKRIDVVTQGSYIEKDVQVKVTQVTGNQVVVDKV